MPYWLALIPSSPAAFPSAPEPAAALLASAGSQQRAIGWWALQFTPRVSLLEEAVVLEVEASQRLFGGGERLRERVFAEALALGCEAVAAAPTSLGALALARCGLPDGFVQPLHRLLDALPLESLSAAAAQRPVLARLGCRTLGEVRGLPRGGMNRRFGKDLLAALDRAYGAAPESHAWLALPEVFEARLELPGRVEDAPAMMAGARRLLLQMAGWLAARHAGVLAFTLRWLHDAHRPRDIDANGALCIRTAEATRDIEHLARLLGEHLARVNLKAPVGDLVLQADEVQPLQAASASLLLDAVREREPLHQLLERLSARLGPQRVRRPVLASDHRIEWMQHWLPATQPLPRAAASPAEGLPQPSWVLPQPLKLLVRQDKPMYQGVLQLLAGPHRIEAGWWDSGVSGDRKASRQRQVGRDYYVALSPHAGLLWIYRERLPGDEPDGHWFLHGVFA
ncbi:DNA polymerase Y family protein [Aquabacterium sp. A7-Y]|uniref:Y-family DNA polymerase n=1 Tax=Aquabacterium sp. A7-Y TaxID=1349605 RepID=UPI00223C9B4C|nr:DNA polymerase Y family protein [Aquabacterium sp. A7-Y]MCW7537000.1 DNA polymerase Y family protein [Aquabacterium sp. A7-Y]